MLSKTQIKRESMLLQSRSTIKLGTYYLIRSKELTNNEYIFYNDGKILEIIIKNIDEITTMHIGGYQLQNHKLDTINNNTIQFNEENETEILQILQRKYLNDFDCIHWNHMIGDFFGANFYTFKKINFLMPIKQKLLIYAENQSLLKNYINNAQISDNINQLSKHIKHKKGKSPQSFIEHFNIPFFTQQNNKKQTIENLIIERKFETALNMLNINTTTYYNSYDKHIYSIICLQCLYKEANDMINKRKYFKRMREYLEELTLFMESSDPMTCALIVECFQNYNPFKLSQQHEQFINNIVISGCCYMFTDLNSEYIIYNLYGSINCYFYLLYLIENNKLISNNKNKEIIVKTIDELFQTFDSYQLQSPLFALKLQEKKVLWNIKKQNILNSVYIKQEKENNLFCDICGKGPFKHMRALGGHKHIHAMKSCNSNIKEIKKEKYISEKTETKEKSKKYKKRLKLKLNSKYRNIYKCKYCDHQSDYKQNIKRHTLNLHQDLNLKGIEVEPMVIREKINKQKTLTPRKRKKQLRNKENEMDEPLKKKQKLDSKCDYDIGCDTDEVNRKCNECGKICKTKSGLGTHKWHVHGISGICKSSIRRRDKKNKNNLIVISDSNVNGKIENDGTVVVKMKGEIGIRKCLSKMPKLQKMPKSKKVRDDDDGDEISDCFSH